MKKKNKKIELRLISWVCIFALTISMFSALLPIDADASAANFTQAQAVTWINNQVGKSLDHDKQFGAQCVDLIKYYYEYLGVPVANGHAKEYNTSAAPRCPTGWTRVTSNPQPGDVIVWPETPTNQYGHIGLITEVNGTNLTTVEQNINGDFTVGGPATRMPRTTSGVACYLRPNFKSATTYTIKYNANGGTGTMANTTVTHGVSTNIRVNTFIRTGFDFDGWFGQRASDNRWRYQSADGSSTGWYAEGSQPSGWTKFRFKDGGSVSATVSAGDTATFYAQWKAATTYTIKYNANGGTGSMSNTTVTHGVSMNIRANTFIRIGYDFDGWFGQRASDSKWRYQSADGSSTGWYTEGSQPSGWTKFRFKDGGSVSATVSAGDTATFYAQWKVSTTYTIKYNANGGTGTMANTIVTHGVSMNIRTNTFVRTGYVFDGWFGKRASDSKWRYQSADGSSTGWHTEGSQPSGWTKFRFKDGGSVSATVSIGDVATFYAQWK